MHTIYKVSGGFDDFRKPHFGSQLRILLVEPKYDATPPAGKIHLFSQIAVTFEPIQRFGFPSQDLE